MSERLSVNQRIQIGKEDSPGTAVPAVRRLRSFEFAPRVRSEFQTHRPEGGKRVAASMLVREWTEVAISGLATYSEIGYALASMVGLPETESLGGGVYRHRFRSRDLEPDLLASYTCEYGSPVRAFRFAGMRLGTFGLRTTPEEVQTHGRAYALPLEDGIALTAGPNEAQTVSLLGAPSGGSFLLGFESAWTEPIPFNAASLVVEAALLELPPLGEESVEVTGEAGGPYTVTFVGELGGANQPLLHADGDGLTGGDDPSVEVVEAVRGGLAEAPLSPILPGDLSLTLSDAPDGLGQPEHRLQRVLGTDWSFEDRHRPFWVQNASHPSFAGSAEGAAEETVQLYLAADATGMDLLALARAGGTRFLRIDASSRALRVAGTEIPYRLTFDAAVQVDDVREFRDDQGLYAAGYRLRIVQDAGWGKSFEFVLVNETPGY